MAACHGVPLVQLALGLGLPGGEVALLAGESTGGQLPGLVEGGFRRRPLGLGLGAGFGEQLVGLGAGGGEAGVGRPLGRGAGVGV
ncbi:hypothetical protein ACFV5M_13135 [Streptomyces albidoflavus]